MRRKYEVGDDVWGDGDRHGYVTHVTPVRVKQRRAPEISERGAVSCARLRPCEVRDNKQMTPEPGHNGELDLGKENQKEGETISGYERKQNFYVGKEHVFFQSMLSSLRKLRQLRSGYVT